MALAPTANEISVREVLAKFETEFALVANAVENGEFALWVGSGISREAPNLGNLIERAFDYIRERAIAPATAGAYLPALEEALGLAEIDPANVETRQVTAYLSQLTASTSRVSSTSSSARSASQDLSAQSKRLEGEVGAFIRSVREG